MEEKKIRIGIIGYGVQGSTYASFLSGKHKENAPKVDCPKHCSLGAICDIDEAKEKEAKELLGEYPFYKDYKEMILSGDVDAVITTVPHYLHPEMAIFAMEHGIHVLGEKPAGVYTKQVLEMNACAKKHPNIVFAIMFNQRTNALYKKVKGILDSGELGELRRSSWIINSWWRPDSYYKQSEWRATWGGEGGGVLVNQAPHQLDLWQWICGKPKKVFAKSRFGAYRDIVVENDVNVLVEYENGAIGSFVTCTHDPIGTDRLEIDLSGGKIVVEDSKELKIYRLKKSEKELNETLSMNELSKLLSSNAGKEAIYDLEQETIEGKWGYQHAAVMENFAKAILFGEELIGRGEEGIHGVRLANACLLSSWLNQEVDMDFDDSLFLKELNQRILEEGRYPIREQ